MAHPLEGAGQEPSSSPTTTQDTDERVDRAAGRQGLLQRHPDAVTTVIQMLKGVIAATGAWWLSVYVLESELAFLAPWTALLTVHVTVSRSLSRGLQTTVASALGVALSFVVGAALGVSLWTFALALLIGLLLANLRWIRDEGTAVATTAIFVLGSGFSEQAPLLGDRLLEIAIGVGIGIAVNALILPPLRDQQAASYVDRINRHMGTILTEMSDEFARSWDTDRGESWLERTQQMEAELDHAWSSAQYARESRRANPRRLSVSGPRRRNGAQRTRPRPEDIRYEQILPRVDEGISHLRHLTRTLRDASYVEGEWDEHFRERWVQIVRETGLAVADPDAEVAPIQDRLSALTSDLSDDRSLPRLNWPLYGSLITSVRHVLVVVDDVASARAAREAPST